MGIMMCEHEPATEKLVLEALGGDAAALAELFRRYEARLKRMVRLRLHPRLQGRLDPSDVLQEAYFDLAGELPHYAESRPMEFFLWMRMVVAQRLMRIHRKHLGAQLRDAEREVSIYRGSYPHASSISLASQLLGRLTAASEVAMRAEAQAALHEALNQMDEIDREIIALRNFEELTNSQAAVVLGMEPSATSKRYIRALTRLQHALGRVPGLAMTDPERDRP